MARKNLFNYIASLILVIYLLNFIANKFYWYYSIWWFDMPMHFLGGLWLGMFFIWLHLRLGKEPRLGYSLTTQVLGWVVLVGVGWEVFEYGFINYVAGNTFFIKDTVSDIFFDLAGGLTGIVIYFKSIMKINEFGLK